MTVYELTGAGRALQPALSELLDWGLRHGPDPSPDDVIQPGWALLVTAGRPTALLISQLRGLHDIVHACQPRCGSSDSKRRRTR